MKNLYLCSFLLLLLLKGYAQMENANWVFGTTNTLAFPSITMGSLPGTTTFKGVEGVASCSDRNGNLLFYTDGRDIFDAGHNIIASGLLGNPSSAQNVIIVPRPNHNMRFYIVTIVGATSYYPPNAQQARLGLHFSELSMELPNPRLVGMPNITLEDDIGTPINAAYSNLSEGITSTLHADSDKYWVVAHIQGSRGEFVYSYEVTEDGIGGVDLEPASSLNLTTSAQARCMKISPNGERIAIATVSDGVYVGSFNRSDGDVIIGSTLLGPENMDASYGVEFSQNSNVLYYSGYNNTLGHSLNRLDLSTSTLFTDSEMGYVRAIQMGMDNRMYVTRYLSSGSTYMDLLVVTNTDNVTNAFVDDTFVTMNDPLESGLPQWIWRHSCEPNLRDNVNVIPGNVVQEQRSEWIELSNTIVADLTNVDPDGRAIYHAGHFIEMLPDVNPLDPSDSGFEAEYDSEFLAEIVPCDTSFVYRNGETEQDVTADSKSKKRAEEIPGPIKIYPNPSSTTITVESDTSLKTITILSIDGKTMLSQSADGNSKEIDVSGLAKGIYLMVTETQDGKIRNHKFIKN